MKIKRKDFIIFMVITGLTILIFLFVGSISYKENTVKILIQKYDKQKALKILEDKLNNADEIIITVKKDPFKKNNQNVR